MQSSAFGYNLQNKQKIIDFYIIDSSHSTLDTGVEFPCKKNHEKKALITKCKAKDIRNP